ncbi:MAG: hypothetical protein IJB44_05985, partial [Clostridia bacterium]|nr:hypothetical protein [Clostridia bacterium]
MKKLFAFLFVLIFALGLISCAAPEEIVPEYVPMGDNVDFGGTEFTYLTEEQDAFIGIKQGTLLYDCVLERIDSLEK